MTDCQYMVLFYFQKKSLIAKFLELCLKYCSTVVEPSVVKAEKSWRECFWCFFHTSVEKLYKKLGHLLKLIPKRCSGWYIFVINNFEISLCIIQKVGLVYYVYLSWIRKKILKKSNMSFAIGIKFWQLWSRMIQWSFGMLNHAFQSSVIEDLSHRLKSWAKMF